MAPLSKIRSQIRKKVADAKFPFATRARVEDIIVRAISHFRLHRNRSKFSRLPLPGSTRFRVEPQKRGPKDKKAERMYLLSQLHFAWLVGFNEYPKINNKDYRDRPFVVFVESILLSEGIARIHGNLEEFRSYRKQQLAASGFKLVRGQVK